jgi:hypothetical protein
MDKYPLKPFVYDVLYDEAGNTKLHLADCYTIRDVP